MRSIATLAVVLACTACQPQPDSMLVATAPGEAQLAQKRTAAQLPRPQRADNGRSKAEASKYPGVSTAGR